MQDVIDSLGGMKYFTVLDLKSAYFQGYMHPDSCHLTAFTCPMGLYEYVRVPFGLKKRGQCLPTVDSKLSRRFEG